MHIMIWNPLRSPKRDAGTKGWIPAQKVKSYFSPAYVHIEIWRQERIFFIIVLHPGIYWRTMNNQYRTVNWSDIFRQTCLTNDSYQVIGNGTCDMKIIDDVIMTFMCFWCWSVSAGFPLQPTANHPSEGMNTTKSEFRYRGFPTWIMYKLKSLQTKVQLSDFQQQAWEEASFILTVEM